MKHHLIYSEEGQTYLVRKYLKLSVLESITIIQTLKQKHDDL